MTPVKTPGIHRHRQTIRKTHHTPCISHTNTRVHKHKSTHACILTVLLQKSTGHFFHATTPAVLVESALANFCLSSPHLAFQSTGLMPRPKARRGVLHQRSLSGSCWSHHPLLGGGAGSSHRRCWKRLAGGGLRAAVGGTVGCRGGGASGLLMMAVDSHLCRVETARMLLEAQADPNAQVTPQYYCSPQGGCYWGVLFGKKNRNS